MRIRPVSVYSLPRNAGPGAKPRLIESLTIKSETVDGARDQLKLALAKRGLDVRSMSFLEDGGMSAIVFSK